MGSEFQSNQGGEKMGRLGQILKHRVVCRFAMKLAALGILLGVNIPADASVATARHALESRVDHLRLSLDVQTTARSADPPVIQISQAWNNWPNWGNWNNWANWNNWPNWGNWLNR
jgi:hypothetical protein